MKIKFALLLTFLTANLCIAQDNFTVIKVSGTVLSQKNNRALISGDKIQSKDALRFNSKDAYIILYSPKTGRKIIKGVPDESPHEFMELLQSYVKPSDKSTASRNAGSKYLDQLEQMLKYDTLLILGDGRIPIETDKLKIDKPAGIRVIYKSGSNTRQKTISDNQSFSLNRSTVFDKEIPAAMPQVALQYYVNEAEDFAFAEGTFIGKFVPRYVEEVELKKEVSALMSAMAENSISDGDQFKEIKGFLVWSYGGIIDENLKSWLKANKMIK